MCFQLIQIFIVRQVTLKMFRSAECIQISKDCVSFYATRIRHFDMVRIGVHTHDLLANFFFCIGQIDAVARDLLIFALPSVPGRRQHTSFSGISAVGSTSVSPYTLLNLRTISLACSIIGSWSSPTGTVVALKAVISDAWLIVGEKSYRDACLKITHLNLSLNGWVSLQSGNSNQIHIEKGELCQLRNL